MINHNPDAVGFSPGFFASPSTGGPALKGTASLLVILVLTWPTLLLAQVRQAPDGNSLPPEHPPLTAQNALLPADGHALPTSVSLTAQQHRDFAQQVDLSGFRRLAVFNGRAKIIDTLAREHLERIYGKSVWKDLTSPGSRRYDPVFTLLDLVFNRDYYFSKPILYVEVLPLRQALLQSAGLTGSELETWKKDGRLAPMMFTDPRVLAALRGADGDLRLIRGQNQVIDAVNSFMDVSSMLAVVSPSAGQTRWSLVTDIKPSTATSPSARQALEEWNALESAWRKADAAGVNQSLARLSELLPAISPSTYSPGWQRELEYIYNMTDRFTIGYVDYFIAAVILLVALGTQRRGLIRAGVALLILGALFHFAGIAVRGILAHRWPIHNQYESYIAISFFGVLVGILLMFTRRQWLYGAAAAALGACALAFANTVPIPSDETGPVAGILATSRILYVHVNLVLASYALIALGWFVSVFYLIMHYLGDRSAGRMAATSLGIVAVEGDAPAPGKARLLHDLDQAQMVVLQLAFWGLGVGILLGAYWADHAWGRWWGWDPKETWALITWIVYLIVIHTRLGVKNRGLATAWLSFIGFFVMLWTYWGVNLLLAGLHSYA